MVLGFLAHLISVSTVTRSRSTTELYADVHNSIRMPLNRTNNAVLYCTILYCTSISGLEVALFQFEGANFDSKGAVGVIVYTAVCAAIGCHTNTLHFKVCCSSRRVIGH